jgi:hypothetical protein
MAVRAGFLRAFHLLCEQVISTPGMMASRMPAQAPWGLIRARTTALRTRAAQRPPAALATRGWAPLQKLLQGMPAPPGRKMGHETSQSAAAPG